MFMDIVDDSVEQCIAVHGVGGAGHESIVSYVKQLFQVCSASTAWQRANPTHLFPSFGARWYMPPENQTSSGKPASTGASVQPTLPATKRQLCPFQCHSDDLPPPWL